MRKLIVLPFLLASTSFAGLKLSSTVDLSACKTNGKTVKTGFKDKINVVSESAVSDFTAVKSSATFNIDGGWDGDPAFYSCVYSSEYGNAEFTTNAFVGKENVFSASRTTGLYAVEKIEEVGENDKCNANLSYPLYSSISIVPTGAGQVVVKGSNYTALINFHSSITGAVVSKYGQKWFAPSFPQYDTITFSIFKAKANNNDDILFQDCQASITIE